MNKCDTYRQFSSKSQYNYLSSQVILKVQQTASWEYITSLFCSGDPLILVHASMVHSRGM